VLNDTAMVFVEGGTFTMGCTQGPDDRYEGEEGESWNVTCPDDEQPAHKVTITKDFYIGKYEVTQKLWFDVMGTTIEQQRALIYKRDPNYKDLFLVGVGDNYPMYFVSWNEIQQFLGKLNKLTGKNYRLPTEAEWDFAARGGNESKGYKYYGSDNRDEVAWYEKNNGSYGKKDCYCTKPVGTKKPNELGIHDMDGNVLEWVGDRWGKYTAEAKTDPQGPPSGKHRLTRGTGFDARADIFRPTFRLIHPPDYAFEGTGFRLAMDP
jgi:formylglycine-generating enzyme required for sulfatase activity